MQNSYCLFADCKKPTDHHNTVDHQCGDCGIFGHSRELHGKPEQISGVLCADGRGKSCCRICNSTNHLTGHHGCKKCGALGHTEAYCRITKRGADPWHRFILESMGDYLPRDKWCTVENCSVRHMHVKNDHPCNDCGYRHGASSGVHYALTCHICRAVCRISQSSLRPDDDAEEAECNVCYQTNQQCRLSCGHSMCADCLDKWLAEESSKSIKQQYGNVASTTTREQAVDIYKIARERFNAHAAIKVYTLIKHGDLTVKASRTTRNGAVDAVAYQSMNAIETSAVHNRMRTDGFALVE